MHHKFLLCLALLPSITIHAMEKMPHDIIVYTISPRLNRLSKNALRLTNKKYAQLVNPQTFLNKHYREACKAGNKDLMLEWHKKGALAIDEEMYELYNNDEPILKNIAQKLYLKNTQLEPLCKNSVFTYGITQNNKKFIMWLLDIEYPAHNSEIITNAISLAKTLKYNDIISQLEWYATKTKPGHRSSFHTMPWCESYRADFP